MLGPILFLIYINELELYVWNAVDGNCIPILYNNWGKYGQT